MPQELQFQCKDTFKPVGENRNAKMHIFVVNGRYIAKFFKLLTEGIGSLDEKSWRTIDVEFTEFYKTKKA